MPNHNKSIAIICTLSLVNYQTGFADTSNLNKTYRQALSINRQLSESSPTPDTAMHLLKQPSRDQNGKVLVPAIFHDSQKNHAVETGNSLADSADGLSQIAARRLREDKEEQEAANMVLKAERERKIIKDITTSQLFVRAEQITSDPKTTLTIIEKKNREHIAVPINTNKVTKVTMKSCEITRSPEEHVCTHHIKLDVKYTSDSDCVCSTPWKSTAHAHVGKWYTYSINERRQRYAIHDDNDADCSFRSYYNPKNYICICKLLPLARIVASRRKHSVNDPNCVAKIYDPTVHKKHMHITAATWVSECGALEQRKECQEIIAKRKCLDGPSTRNINGFPVTRDCWQRQLTYSCQYPITPGSECSKLRIKDCEAIDSKCIFTVDDKCYTWQQKYQCLTTEPTNKPKVISIKGRDTFCLHGECFTWPNDQAGESELGEAIANLQLFKEIADDNTKVINSIENKDSSFIFRGEEESCCRYSPAGILLKDCCDYRGWFKKHCQEEQVAAARKHANGQCFSFGTECVEKIKIPPKIEIPICIRHKTVFCCFQSKLMRIIHEQGRPQVRAKAHKDESKMLWGSFESPNCRGFSPEELVKIDFSSMDLSELHQDILNRFQPKDTRRLQEKMRQKMQQMQRSTNPLRDLSDA